MCQHQAVCRGGNQGNAPAHPEGVCYRHCIFAPIVSWKLCGIPLEFCSRAIHLTRPASFQSFDISPTPNYYFQCTVRPLITDIGFPVPAVSHQNLFCIWFMWLFFSFLIAYLYLKAFHLQFEKKYLTFFLPFSNIIQISASWYLILVFF